jgi:hypothetical protein
MASAMDDMLLPLPLRAWAAKWTKVGGRGSRGTDSAETTPPPIPLPQGEGEKSDQ